ncbi:MAG: carboxypeptidase-like regulatory domain-containing protein [Bacteroidota bacterium]
MIKKITSLLMLLCMITLSAQENKRISGKVVDAETGDPLAFSHVGIFNSSYGTVANAEGDFSLIIPSEYRAAELSASYLGYALKSIPIVAIENTNEVKISLTPMVTELPELVIQTKEKSIIEEAVEAIPLNHDQGEMQLRAFWRSSLWNKAKAYVQMTEYAFDMFRHGESGREKNDMKILHGRVARDTAFFRAIGGVQIGVTPPSLFTNSLLKGYPILDQKVIKNHDYKIVDVTSYQERAVYVVGFEPKAKAKGSLFKGEILLDTETLAFVKISYKKLISKEDPEKVFSSFGLASILVGLGNSTQDRYEIDMNYQYVNGLWYLSYARYDIDWTIRRSKKDIIRPLTLKADFVVTEIEKEDINVPPSEELASKSILQQQTAKGTKDFWNAYNYLKPDNDFDRLFEEILDRE